MFTTPRAVVERVLRAGREMDFEAVAALMAPDGCLEWPYRPAGMPARLQGRDEIRAFLSAASEAPIRWDEFRDVVVHETTDPEVIIVEYEAHGHVTTTGAPLRQTIIAVFRVHHGEIVVYRDYLNPLALADADITPPTADTVT